jgi:putative phosphoesterase
MRLGIVSDIHDNLWNLAPAIAFLNQQADVLICCGDLCSPFVMDELRKFRGDVHIVFGNNDADLFRITRRSDARLQLHGEMADLEFGGRRIAVQHFDNIASGLADSGTYSLVCFGHNHRVSLRHHDRTLAVNPGPIMGVAFGPKGWEEVAPTFAICDTDSLDIGFHAVRERERVEPFRLQP